MKIPKKNYRNKEKKGIMDIRHFLKKERNEENE